MRRGAARLVAAVVLIAAASGVDASRTKLEPRAGAVDVVAAEGRETAAPGSVMIADRMGRLYRSSATRPETAPGTTTQILVSRGAVVLLTGEVLVAGTEGMETRDTGFGRRIRVRPAGRDALKRISALLAWRAALGLVSPVPMLDRIAMKRITYVALRKLESLDVDGTLALTSRSGRFAGKSFDDFTVVLRKLALITSSLRNDVVLDDFSRTSPNAASAHYVLAMDLKPKTGLVPVVKLAGAGRIRYKRFGRQWTVDGADIAAFNIDTDLLPGEFMELKDMVLGTK